MQIILNGHLIETQETRLDAFLVEQGYVDCSIATAMNEQFIPLALRESTELHDKCSIEVVAPMQGG